MKSAIAFVVFAIAVAAADTLGKASGTPLKCTELQDCLNNESRKCWREFLHHARKPTGTNNASAQIMCRIPEELFMEFVNKTETSLWKYFLEVDANVTKCMTKKGFKSTFDFCGDMRSFSYSQLVQERAESLEQVIENELHPGNKGDASEQESHSREEGKKDEGSCWLKGLQKCINLFPPPSKAINTALSECERGENIAESEELLGVQVGIGIMTSVSNYYLNSTQLVNFCESEIPADAPKAAATKKDGKKP